MTWWTFSPLKAMNADPKGSIMEAKRDTADQFAADLMNTTKPQQDIDPVTWDALLHFAAQGVSAHVMVGSISELLRRSRKKTAA